MKKILTFLILILCVFVVRAPAISTGLPYFYNEDEAHHFNRVVNMVKSGDFDPHYFHKPSLHFYLRMPVVAASFLWNVRKGNIRSVKEIITKDQEGVAGYAFSTSHPGIVKWNRAFSVLLGALTVILVYLVTFNCTQKYSPSVCAALLTAFSPALLEHGATIGVDVVMDLFCLLSTWLAVKYFRGGASKVLYLSALAAGLAISSKYNALPVLLVPIVAALLKKESSSKAANSALSLLLVCIGFFAGSPYILKELPLFLDQFAYEIWHYKIAGHEGHMGEPGIGQAIFYLNWLARDAFGILPLLAAIGGVLVLFKRAKRLTVITCIFPLFFFLLMIEQKVNFTRNMLVVIPYLSILAGVFVARFFPTRGIIAAATIVLLAQPAWSALAFRAQLGNINETRVILEEKLSAQPKTETAVSALLESAPSTFKVPGVSEVLKSDSSFKILMDGFSLLATPSRQKPEHFMSLKGDLKGEEQEQRIVKNPAIKIWGFDEAALTTEEKNNFLNSPEAHRVVLKRGDDEFVCANATDESCWITQKVSRVYIEDLQKDPKFFGRDGLVPFEFTVYNPWAGQKSQITFDDFLAFIDLPKLETGKDQSFVVDMPYTELKTQGYFIITLSEVHSPLHWTGSEDARRLGMAIKSIRIRPR